MLKRFAHLFWPPLFLALALLLSLLASTASAPAQPQEKVSRCAELLRQWPDRTPHPKEWGERLDGIDSILPVKTLTDGDEKHPVIALTPDRSVIALTLDACVGKPGGNCDQRILNALEELHLPATIFVTPSWVKHNPQCWQRILVNPLLEVGSHGLKHRPASVNGQEIYGIKGTASLAELCHEVVDSAKILEKLMREQEAITPENQDASASNDSAGHDSVGAERKIRWFRAGTAFYDEVAVRFIRQAGFRIAGYSITLDQGATLLGAEVASRALSVKGGEILLAHMHRPNSGTGAGLLKALPLLQERGFVFVRLSELNN